MSLVSWFFVDDSRDAVGPLSCGPASPPDDQSSAAGEPTASLKLSWSTPFVLAYYYGMHVRAALFPEGDGHGVLEDPRHARKPGSTLPARLS